MNDGGGDGAGCFDVKEWANTTELTNVEIAGLARSASSTRPLTCVPQCAFDIDIST